ncbi:MDR family MFS transporter [Labrys wisconsinensis]|uniref:EmrB/QacA subfamily drug resistance transporter n=1 Tax=Labrys wisconsinensis TaxID=425677 RepID=A0ABU0JDM4_9HYPH|nr:MDR family MFS transporter [Labrys wisconsinensis]MDQ0472387.1 EmrB/QacA subfamily drug resistance transporter [Labrys wisconsinensis]
MTDPHSEAPVPAGLSHSEIRSIIVGIMVAMFLAALDQTIVATAMPTIGRELNDLEHLPWVVTAYLLTATAVTPLYGKLSDIVGRRTTLLVAIGIFVAGSIACALAPTMLVLILARGLQGLGGGGLISLAQTIIADIVSPKERPRYQAYIAGVFILSSVSGPVLGGFFAEHLHWSVIFWINLPLGLLALWMTGSLLRKLPRHERPHRLDLLGAGVMAAATVVLMLALNWGGVRYGWSSAPILGLFAASALLWALFVARLRTAPEPLIPAEVLANRVVAMGTLAACFGMGVFIGLTIYMPIYLETVYELTASQSGLALLPLMVGTVTGATISGRVMARVDHYKRLPLIGLSIAVAALAILAMVPRGLPLAALEVVMTATSLGLGTLLPVSTVAIQNAVMPHQMGTATGTMNFFRSLGGALIVAGFGAIVLGGLPASAQAGLSMERLAASFAEHGLDIAFVFRWVFAAAALGLTLSLCALAAMEERPLKASVHEASAAAE